MKLCGTAPKQKPASDKAEKKPASDKAEKEPVSDKAKKEPATVSKEATVSKNEITKDFKEAFVVKDIEAEKAEEIVEEREKPKEAAEILKAEEIKVVEDAPKMENVEKAEEMIEEILGSLEEAIMDNIVEDGDIKIDVPVADQVIEVEEDPIEFL